MNYEERELCGGVDLKVQIQVLIPDDKLSVPLSRWRSFLFTRGVVFSGRMSGVCVCTFQMCQVTNLSINSVNAEGESGLADAWICRSFAGSLRVQSHVSADPEQPSSRFSADFQRVCVDVIDSRIIKIHCSFLFEKKNDS